jgi:hypothetical protein
MKALQRLLVDAGWIVTLGLGLVAAGSPAWAQSTTLVVN